MERDDILRNAETFETAARDSMHESNRQIFSFADLLIKIAFAIAGLSATFVVNNHEQELLHAKWGIIFVCLSIIFGGAQMLMDSRYFREHGKKWIAAADRWKFWAINKEHEEAYLDAKRSLENFSNTEKSSNTYPLIIQMVFVITGAVFVLIEVFQF